MYKPFGREWKKAMMRNSKEFIVDVCADVGLKCNAKEQALIDLFQACSDLSLDEMNRMEQVINAASKAIAL